MVEQINIEILEAQAEKVQEEKAREDKADGRGHSAVAGLMRELIRTPAFKEMVNLFLRDISPENARELVRTLLWEDVGFFMGALGAMPQIISYMGGAVAELGVQLNNIPPPFLKEALGAMQDEIDIEVFKSIPAAFSPILKTMSEQMQESTDFGKLRITLTEFFETHREAMVGEPPMPDIMMLINLLGVVPPMVNFMLRFMAWHLAGLDMPPEIIANVVFTIVDDIDKAELAGLLNVLASQVISLHRGNLLLGRDEPKLKEVATRFARDLVEAIDTEQIKEAALSFVDDGRVISEVISSYIFDKPDNTATVLKAVFGLVNNLLRGAAENSRKIADLPPKVMSDLAEHMEETFEGRELGRLMTSNADFLNKLVDQNPDMATEMIKKVLAAIDLDIMAKSGKAMLLQARDAVFADPAINSRLQPDAIGYNINTSLASFNRFYRENPDLVADKVSETLAVLDTRELRKAVDGMVTPMTRAFLKNGAVLRAIIMPVIWGNMKAMGATIRDRVASRRSRK